MLELGRSCIAKDARNTATMQMLWRGIALYVFHYDIELMFGCASLPGTDPSAHARRCPISITTIWRRRSCGVRALPERYVEMRHARARQLRPAQGARARAAADQGLSAARRLCRRRRGDRRQFNTTDVFIIVKTELVTEKYMRHYERGASDKD